jgi:hypothetical protein
MGKTNGGGDFLEVEELIENSYFFMASNGKPDFDLGQWSKRG